MSEPFPLLLPDGIAYTPKVVSTQVAFSEVTHEPLPKEFDYFPPIAYEFISKNPNITKENISTSHISSDGIDFMMLWNGFLSEFPAIISPGQTYDACVLFIKTYRPLIDRKQLSYHLMSVMQLDRLSSIQVMQLLSMYDGDIIIDEQLIPQCFASIINEKKVLNKYEE